VIFAPQVQGLKGRQMIARGNAPGNCAQESHALKGRNNISSPHIARGMCVALSGLDAFEDVKPRALPCAIILRPFGAGEGMVAA